MYSIAPSVSDGPGSDGVRADSVGPELEREAFGQPPERVLRRRVMGHPLRGRVQRVDRCHVDDRAAVALLDHLARRLSCAPERAVHVHVEDAREAVERHLVDADVRVGGGVVDEHVEPAETLDRRGDQAVDVVRDGHIADRPRNPVTVPGSRRAAASTRVRPAICEQHSRSRLGEPTCSCKAESLCRPRDESSPSAEIEQLGDRLRRRRRPSCQSRVSRRLLGRVMDPIQGAEPQEPVVVEVHPRHAERAHERDLLGQVCASSQSGGEGRTQTPNG